MKSALKLVTLSSAIALSSNALADVNPLYVFGDIGFNVFHYERFDDYSSGWSIGGGYTLTDNVSVELAYNNMGEVDIRQSNTVLGEYELESISGVVNIGQPIGGSNFAYAIFGAALFEEEVTPTNLADTLDAPSDVELVAGVGLEVNRDAPNPARLSITAFGEVDIVRFTIGLKMF